MKQTGKTWEVSNKKLRLMVSERDAGAVCSLIYDGLELVNDHDHGRQLQVAWIYNDLDEAYNPTEAGASDDLTGPRSTSQLLSVKARGTTLETVSHPAYWHNTSIPEEHRKNTALVTKDTLSKKLTLGYKGDPNVLVFDITLKVSQELTGPPISQLRIEAPTLYANRALSEHSVLDFVSGVRTMVPLRSQRKDTMNTVIDRVTDHRKIPILSTPDQRHAVAFFAPQPKDFWAYYSWDVPSDDPTNACGKVTTFFKHAAEAGRTYRYRSFIIVGDLSTVTASTPRL